MASAQQARRPPARIVPAIPHRLAKALPATRPITPEESSKGTLVPRQDTPPEQELQSTIAAQPDEQAAAIEPPLTPDSRTSVAGKSEADAPFSAHSPARSHSSGIPHLEHDHSAHTSGGDHSPSASPKLAPSDNEAITAVNGLHQNLPSDTESPPSPLYPSSVLDTGTLAAEGYRVSREPLSHRHQLSAGALVFHSASESPAIPTTPQENEIHTNGQQQQQQQQQRLSTRPAPTTTFFPGHSHHPSKVDAPWFPAPYSMAPPDAVPDIGGDLELPSANGPISYPKPFNGHVSAAAALHSQSPSNSHPGEIPLDVDKTNEQLTIPYQNGTRPPPGRFEESAFELAAYLSTQVGNPELADFILQVRSPDSILVSIPVHGILVVRSPVIAEAIRRSPPLDHHARDSHRLINVCTLDPFVTRESLEEAIRLLYGAPLLSPEPFLYGLGPYLYESGQMSPSSDARRRMQQVLSYIAAARSLQLPSMQGRGVDIARMLLRWDTIELVLQYGLQASSGPRFRSEGPESDDVFVTALLSYAIDFMAYTFPVDFKLYTIAAELQDAPRLPTLIETRTPTHNPRLSRIRFGDAPPEDDLQPNHAVKVLSTILLSLPLTLVERVFNHRATANQIGWTGALKLMQDVVNERESRRQKALRGQLKPSHDGRIPSPLLSNMYVEESVEPSSNHPSGYRLATKVIST